MEESLCRLPVKSRGSEELKITVKGRRVDSRDEPRVFGVREQKGRPTSPRRSDPLGNKTRRIGVYTSGPTSESRRRCKVSGSGVVVTSVGLEVRYDKTLSLDCCFVRNL